MEEDEFVISNWQRPDSQTEFNEATEKRFINKKPAEVRASKENVENLNLWLDSGETGNRNMKFNNHNSEVDEVSLDDDVLSRLIEGDLKSEEDALSKSRPKPKPRHKESSNTPRNDLANRLFSGKSEKTDVHHNETSPRPVPRPRSKPILKENLSGSFSDKNNLGDSGNAFKLSADKLFDSKGKGNKTVSFHDVSDKHDALPKSEKTFGDIKHDSRSGLKEDFGKKRSSETSEKKLKSPPTKPVRTKSKSLGDKKAHESSGDEADTVHSQGSSHVPGQRRPPPRQPKDNFKQHNLPAHPASEDSFEKQHNGPSHKQQHNGPSHEQQHVSEREWNSNGFTNSEDFREDFRENFSSGQQEPPGRNTMRNNAEDFNVKNQRFVERMEPRDDNVSAGSSVSQKQFMGSGQNRTAINHLNNQDFERSEHGRLMNSKPSPRKHQDLGNSQKDFRKGHNVTQMFEEHVPNTENMLGQTEQRDRREGGRIEGKYKNTPLKAEKRLEEMTKSPELYNFHYDSRDMPQNLKYTSLKSSGDSGLSAKRSSSLTNLNDWRNTESDEDKEDSDGLESWRSGFTSSTSIRQAVYNEWLEGKKQGLKDKSRKKSEEKKNEEEKLKEKEERHLSAKKAFESWSSSKEEAIKKHVKKKKEVKDKEIDEKREKMVKRKDAKKFFESWKSKKDELLKESYKEKKTNEKDEKRKEIEDKQEKIDIAKKSYEKWKVRKDEHIKEEVKDKLRGEKLKTKYQKEAEKEKQVECERTFQEFLKKKGMWKRPPPSPTLTQRAWCPGGLTKGTNLIPGNIQPVIPTARLNRSQSFSGMSTTLR